MVEEEKTPVSKGELSDRAKILYDRLVGIYNIKYGIGKQVLGKEIKKRVEQGISREKAVFRLAIKERLNEPKEPRKKLSLMMKCSKCEEEMERGYFLLDSLPLSQYAMADSICLWTTETPRYLKKRFGESLDVPEDSFMVIWGDSIGPKSGNVLRGFRCPHCELITFEY
jgi:hypothetical protein